MMSVKLAAELRETDKPKVILGAGTGLGVAALVPPQ